MTVCWAGGGAVVGAVVGATVVVGAIGDGVGEAVGFGDGATVALGVTVVLGWAQPKAPINSPDTTKRIAAIQITLFFNFLSFI